MIPWTIEAIDDFGGGGGGWVPTSADEISQSQENHLQKIIWKCFLLLYYLCVNL